MKRKILSDTHGARLSVAAVALGAAIALAVGCVTINVYFPEAAIKDLSEKIEDEVEKRAAEVGGDEQSRLETPAKPGPILAIWARLAPSLLRLSAAPAQAQGGKVADPGVTNPAIRQIIDSRARRLAELNRLKASGVLGENNRALVEIRNLDAVADLRERAAAQRLVKEENADRETMFKEIAAATNVDLSQLPRIRSTYAETLRQNAERGDWIQMPDGTWKQK